MHEKIYGIHKGHIEKFISRIREDLYAETVPLQAEYAVSREPVKFRDRRKLRYKKIGEGELWGHEWESAWFHMQGVVPKAWKGREIALHLNLSGESMLFDAQGVPVYAFSAGSAFDTLFAEGQRRFAARPPFLGGPFAGDNIAPGETFCKLPRSVNASGLGKAFPAHRCIREDGKFTV